ncbi:MAG: type II/IV secretion system protein [Candidatus Aureabacteria bacterium]|nr:type II/IV secretion system protein [Candidatus Auribacterota bacterium]
MTSSKKITIWEKLVQEEILSQDQLQLVLKHSEATGETIQKVMIKLGIMTEKELLKYLADFYSIPILDLSSCTIKKSVVDLIPHSIASRYLLFPVFKIGNTLTLAVSDPLDFYGQDHVQRHTQLNVKTVLSTESSIAKAIEQYYGSIDSTHSAAQMKGMEPSSSPHAAQSKVEWVEDAPIINVVNNMIEQAVDNNASDIHIEPEEKFVRIRLRMDGILNEVSTPPKDVEAGIISRIKIMAGMNIAEKRKPQDGRCKVSVKGKEVDFRISTIPTSFGENMVIRILDKGQLILPLEELGFTSEIEAQWKELIKRPYGILLVTGPSGSGKTTTLYSSINRINSTDVNIMTVEDPIEYQLDMIRQMQVNAKMDITFTSGLRSILRQDPDVIMVGEIRDRDTAEIAIQAALTGHLVLTTLHTNDAAGALTRLIEMGIEPFLVSSSVIGVLAQRLVRVLCPACCRKRPLREEDMAIMGIADKEERNLIMGEPVGCKQCRNKGYMGRVGVFELLPIGGEVRKMIVSKVITEEIRQKGIALGMNTLFENGLEKVVKGITSLQELLRVSVK